MLRGLWLAPQPPDGIVEALRRFWFDVTKSDWRDTTVLTVPPSMITDRAAMYWFDVRQQFGVAGPILAALGMVYLAVTDRARAVLMFLLFAVNAAFAYTYNVGDSHVFYLPSHAMLALLAGCGIALAGRAVPRAAPTLAAGLVVYAAARAYIDKPALDRSRDVRPTQALAALTDGVGERQQVLLVDVSWQVLNGLAYFAKVVRPDVLFAWMPDVLLYAPALQRDNAAIDRSLVATARAADDLQRAYGPWFTLQRLTPVSPEVSEFAGTIPAGTRYVLCVLKPTRDYTIDRNDAATAVRVLTGGHSVSVPDGDYAAVAGIAGQPATIARGTNRPFAERVAIGGMQTTIRMDSWLATDTIRRMGFGHVIASRQPTLIVERGISIATFGEDGTAIQTRYFGNYFAAQARYLIGIGAALR
jgi:hypothetical protein